MGRVAKTSEKEDPFIFEHRKSWWLQESIGEGTGARYSERFRKAALRAVHLRGEHSIKWVCQQLGISTGIYWIWRSEAREKPVNEGRAVIRKRRERKRGISKLLGELV